MIGRVFCISALCLYIILLILLSIRFDFYCIVLFCCMVFEQFWTENWLGNFNYVHVCLKLSLFRTFWSGILCSVFKKGAVFFPFDNESNFLNLLKH